MTLFVFFVPYTQHPTRFVALSTRITYISANSLEFATILDDLIRQIIEHSAWGIKNSIQQCRRNWCRSSIWRHQKFLVNLET